VSLFRQTPKVRTLLLLPRELDDRLRAARGRQSLSAIVSAAVCDLLGLDRSAYGLEDLRPSPEAPDAVDDEPPPRSADR
jgi:hypothetical protein